MAPASLPIPSIVADGSLNPNERQRLEEFRRVVNQQNSTIEQLEEEKKRKQGEKAFMMDLIPIPLWTGQLMLFLV